MQKDQNNRQKSTFRPLYPLKLQGSRSTKFKVIRDKEFNRAEGVDLAMPESIENRIAMVDFLVKKAKTFRPSG